MHTVYFTCCTCTHVETGTKQTLQFVIRCGRSSLVKSSSGFRFMAATKWRSSATMLCPPHGKRKCVKPVLILSKFHSSSACLSNGFHLSMQCHLRGELHRVGHPCYGNCLRTCYVRKFPRLRPNFQRTGRRSRPGAFIILCFIQIHVYCAKYVYLCRTSPFAPVEYLMRVCLELKYVTSHACSRS